MLTSNTADKPGAPEKLNRWIKSRLSTVLSLQLEAIVLIKKAQPW